MCPAFHHTENEMQDIKDYILNGSRELKEELIRLRRHIHTNPELSFEEHNTASFICTNLDRIGIKYRKGVAGTGVIGEIRGELKSNKVIGLRAEMDALPVTEMNISDYSSRNIGKMHACGHDAHVAMLLGTAHLLGTLIGKFGGTILFIFQPGEELAPGGARLMIESGAFNDPKPGIILAQHVLPELETGKVGYRRGRYMASSDEIYITIKGKGGHAALPGLTTDQIYIASNLITRLKDAISEAQSINEIPTVLGFGKMVADGATNVIPAKVEIAGTFRTFDEKWRSDAKKLIRKISADTAREFGVAADVNIADGYPVLFNNEKLTDAAVKLSSDLLGRDRIESFDLRMSSDDFAFFSEAFPSVYYRVGIKKSGEQVKMLHSSEFDIDEEGLVTGVANMSWLAFNLLMDDYDHQL
jgi:amidohydrolase